MCCFNQKGTFDQQETFHLALKILKMNGIFAEYVSFGHSLNNIWYNIDFDKIYHHRTRILDFKNSDNNYLSWPRKKNELKTIQLLVSNNREKDIYTGQLEKFCKDIHKDHSNIQLNKHTRRLFSRTDKAWTYFM